MSDQYVGEIRLFAGNYAPEGWGLCDGTLYPISGYETLFSVIGTTYGGNGSTNFAVPDLRGRVMVSQGTGLNLTPRVIGQTGGSENVTILASQLPVHAHALTPANVVATLKAVNVTANNKNPPNNSLAVNVAADTYVRYNTASPDATMNAKSIDAAGSTDNSGSSQPHPNLQPYLTLNYIIALNGYFPQPS